MNSESTSGNVARPGLDWFDDAKLGIMVSWGLYAVPGWAPLDPRLPEYLAGRVTSDGGPFAHMSPMSTTSYSEWYLNSMSLLGSPTWFYHQARYGGAPYDAFRTDFERAVDACDPGEWISLFAEAGARYVVPLTKHHDGYQLYPSTVESPFRPGYHTQRDLIGDIAVAARAQGLRLGLYYSGGIDWTAGGLPVSTMAQLESSREERGPRFWPEPYPQYADAQYREIIDRYAPSILWNDIGYPAQANASELFEYYYSQVPDGIINDRFSEAHADFETPEYRKFDEIRDKKWEMNRGVGLSFGFNRQETEADTLSGIDIVRLLINVVARGGNLMLGVGPDEHGRISRYQEQSLRELGAWMAVNGTAIYSTRPASVPEHVLGAGTVQWTQTPEVLNAIIDGTSGAVVLPCRPDEFELSGVRRLGAGPALAVSAREGGILLEGLGDVSAPIVVSLPRR